MGTGLQRLLAAGACALAATVLMPITASAHAFLVQTSPAAGQRLLMSPPGGRPGGHPGLDTGFRRPACPNAAPGPQPRC